VADSHQKKVLASSKTRQTSILCSFIFIDMVVAKSYSYFYQNLQFVSCKLGKAGKYF